MKIYYSDGVKPASQIGDALDSLSETINKRKDADSNSYTYRLLHDDLDKLLKKINEEAFETSLAAKDCDLERNNLSSDLDHLRYESADLIYHLLVLLARYNISMEELAAELNVRMTPKARLARSGIALLDKKFINRGNHEEK